MTSELAPPIDAVRLAASTTPGLEVLLLFGSRARGDAHARSDWDFGYLGRSDVDVAAVVSAIVEIVGSDRVDLVDLSRAGGLLRYRAARDGVTVFEARPRLAEAFRLDAADFWCDAAPVLRQGYDAVLAGLDR
jgi:predicted nucleotidyltransferase